MQRLLQFENGSRTEVRPFRAQLLKWVGSKQRFAHEIVSFFPARFERYFEPFLGSGAVLGTLAPARAVASDAFQPLMEIWQTLHADAEMLKRWYKDRWHTFANGDKVEAYERIKARYNDAANAADLLFLCRSCYGGVVRFRMADGFMSTPCGAHSPISPAAFSKRVDDWHRRTKGAEFCVMDYTEAMKAARRGDLVYCDPPYKETQSILYGAQRFRLEELFEAIAQCKARGVFVALSIDGTKRSGNRVCNVRIPPRLFEREVFVTCGRSMLRRFQMGGKTLEGEVVADRLLLTY
ncbi:MAG: DNA adenine methylase [Planctomycetia bacterium]|nr:DNA adenine methylase [Planctomycetia bacterium]